MYGVILDMVFNFCDAFLQMLSMCYWNANLLSETTPKSFSQELFLICSTSIMILVFTLEQQIKWHLSQLAFIWLSLNHLKSAFEAFCYFIISSLKPGVIRKKWAQGTLILTRGLEEQNLLYKQRQNGLKQHERTP